MEGRELRSAWRRDAACMSVTAHCTLRGGVVSDGSCTRLKLPRPPCCGALVGLGLGLEVRVRVRVRVRVGVRVRVLRRLEAAQRVEERGQLALQRGGVVAAWLGLGLRLGLGLGLGFGFGLPSSSRLMGRGASARKRRAACSRLGLG